MFWSNRAYTASFAFCDRSSARTSSRVLHRQHSSVWAHVDTCNDSVDDPITRGSSGASSFIEAWRSELRLVDFNGLRTALAALIRAVDMAMFGQDTDSMRCEFRSVEGC
jgi:hypothetical protein